MEKKELFALRNCENGLARIIEHERYQEQALHKEYDRYEHGKNGSRFLFISLPFIGMWAICAPVGTFFGIFFGFIESCVGAHEARVSHHLTTGVSNWVGGLLTKLHQSLRSSNYWVPLSILCFVIVAAGSIYVGIQAASPTSEKAVNWIFLLPVLAFLFAGAVVPLIILLIAYVTWVLPELVLLLFVVSIILGFIPKNAAKQKEERTKEMERIKTEIERLKLQTASEEIILNRWRNKLHENDSDCSGCRNKSKIKCDRN